MNTELQRLRKLASIAQIGWWEADFRAGHYVCSDYLSDLINIKGNTITFEDFRLLIREDHRGRVVEEFNAYIHKEFYDSTFPIKTKYGDVWVRTRLNAREDVPGRGPISFGVIQLVENKQVYSEEHRVNELVRRQNSVSQSLMHFVNEDNLDRCINSVLQDILDFYKGGRVYIFEFDESGEYQNCKYEVVSQGVEPEIDSLQNVSTHLFSWWTSHVLAGKPIILDSLEQLPPEASEEHDILNRQNIKSIMVIPLQSGNRVWGYIGIDLVNDFRKWLDEDYQWFSSLSNIISICIDLRKSKDKVIQEHAFLQNLFSYMPLGYFKIHVIRDKNGKGIDYYISDANLAIAEMTGQTLQYYKESKKLASGVYKDYRLKLNWLLEVVNTDVHKEIDYQFEETGRMARCLLYSPDKDVVVALMLDSTEMVKAHEAMNHSEKLLKSVFANIPVGVEIYDKDGLLIDINQRDMEIFSVEKKEDVIGVDFFSNPNVSEAIKNDVRENDMTEFSMRYSFETAQNYYTPSRQDGIELYTKASKIYDSQGKFNGYILINIDNTERIHDANRINDFENLFLLISNYAHVGYCKFNSANSQGFAMPQWYKNLGEDDGTPLAEIVGTYKNIHPDDRLKLLKDYRDMMKGKTVEFRGDMRIKSPDNKNKWNWISVNIVLTKYEPENNIVELVGVNYDITQLKETEAMLIKAKEKAETMDRLKSAFISNMSHEIRTPLNAIVGFSGLLAETEEAAERMQYLKIIRDNNDLLLRLITDILNLSKMESGALEVVVEKINLTALFDEVVNTIKPKLSPGVKLILRPDPSVSIIESDRYRITQVLLNLAGNAVKFTSKGEITVGYEKHDDAVDFFVYDTGMGIPPDQLTNIFERFVKLNDFIPGTGLGLSISKNIVDELGGNISVTSVLGEGSQFRFKLPCNLDFNQVDREISFNQVF